jgi:hypothetical protein
MERLLWKNYPPGEINEKIEYWVDLWDDLITHFTKTHYGLELVNPAGGPFGLRQGNGVGLD